jgi:protein-S-isoprenylcysteine O-methyltransferase Ste14
MHMFLFRLIVGTIVNMLVYGILLFGPAGTWHWWRAWVVLGILFVGSVASLAILLPGHKDLLVERLKPAIQKGQPLVDKIIVIPFVASYVYSFFISSQDVFHWHLLPKPGIVISSLGLILFLVGWRIVFLALRENRFAAPVVKHQVDRQHTVVDTGVYSVVRHPMYAGVIPLLVGAALWLESYTAALFALVPIGLLAVRIVFEERFLKRKLEGYDAYTQRVRYRLIPFVW